MEELNLTETISLESSINWSLSYKYVYGKFIRPIYTGVLKLTRKVLV